MEIGKIYGYIRISKDTLDMENQRHQINKYCLEILRRNVDEWFEDLVTGKAKATDRELGKLVNKTKKTDLMLIVSTSRFGRNFFDVMLTGSILYEKGAGLYAIQQNFDFSPKNAFAKVFLSIYAFMDEAERESISTRTKAALQRLKDEGVTLGRPKETYNRKLDGNIKDILKLKKTGLNQRQIAKQFNVTRQTLATFLKSIPPV